MRGPAPIPSGPTIKRGLNWNLPVAAANNPGSLALSILNAGYLLDVELSAMQEESRGEVIFNPRVVHQPARGDDQAGQGKSATSPSAAPVPVAPPTPNVQFKEVVLELR